MALIKQSKQVLNTWFERFEIKMEELGNIIF